MLNMSFYYGTLDRKKLAEFVQETEKPILYTYGLGYRHPTTYRKPISKETALDIVKNESLLDATEEGTCLHLNAYSDNDMW